VLRWCSGARRPAANNTVRNRLPLAATFLRWCVREGHAAPAVVEAICDRDNPLRRVPRLYGKVQAKHPARWLTHEEAFGRLLAGCQADGNVGMRDELVLRLGLAGVRAAEIIALTVGDLHLDDSPPQVRSWTTPTRPPLSGRTWTPSTPAPRSGRRCCSIEPGGAARTTR